VVIYDWSSHKSCLSHRRGLESLTGREWQTASRDPSPLIEYGRQNSIGIEEIEENWSLVIPVLIERGHSRDAICHLSPSSPCDSL